MWRKRRWRCQESACPRSSFTESIPQIPSNKRVTRRLRGAAGRAVGRRGAYGSAGRAGLGPVLAGGPRRVPRPRHGGAARGAGTGGSAGIDETRRGKSRFVVNPYTGVFEQIVDRWHTGVVDLAGDRACWGRLKAAPVVMPGRGWPRGHSTGATASRSWRSICARPTGPLCGSIYRARRWWSTTFTSYN